MVSSSADMIISKTASMGLIACPGAGQFTDSLINRLQTTFVKKFKKFAQQLSKEYSISCEEAVREISLFSSFVSGRGRISEVSKPPSFRIPVRFTRFANGEFKAEIQESVRGMDVFIVQDSENHYPLAFESQEETVSLSVNDHVMILFVTMEAVIQSDAASMTLVLPTFPYARQHKRHGREALSASWFARMCEYIGADRIITLDIHSSSIENSFTKINLENLHASYQILIELKKIVDLKDDDIVVVSPDTGAVDRNKFYAGNLKKPLALLYKERDYSRTSNSAQDSNIKGIKLLGDVQNKTVLMADDMLATGGTLIKSMDVLKNLGAKRIICVVSLPLFTGSAIAHFDNAHKNGLFDAVIGTNAVYHAEELLGKKWYIQADITGLFAKIITRLHQGQSLSALLDNSEVIQRLLRRE